MIWIHISSAGPLGGTLPQREFSLSCWACRGNAGNSPLLETFRRCTIDSPCSQLSLLANIWEEGSVPMSTPVVFGVSCILGVPRGSRLCASGTRAVLCRCAQGWCSEVPESPQSSRAQTGSQCSAGVAHSLKISTLNVPHNFNSASGNSS